MGTVAALLDLEEGHTLPNLGLLRLLKSRGHMIYCLGLSDVEDFIRDQGFEFIPIMGDIFPPGTCQGRRWVETRSQYFVPLIRGKVLDDAIARLKPEVMMVHNSYCAEGLIIHLRYSLPIVFFCPSFRELPRVLAYENYFTNILLNLTSGIAELLDLLTEHGVRYNNFKEIAQQVLRFPELTFIPEAFDLHRQSEDPQVFYLGAGVDLERKEETAEWKDFDSNQPMIYCALGSQIYRQQAISRRLFQTIIDVAATRSDWQFMIAVGKTFNAGEFTGIPDNAILTSWAPQLKALSQASVMVNHGGFGTVKECIFMGVPMVVLPLLLDRDHVACAKRVVHHGLGVQGDIRQVSASELSSLIEQVIKDQSYRLRAGVMREKFRQQDRFDIGVKVIEDAMSGCGR